MDEHRSSRLSPEYVMLGYLYQGPAHGYELHKRMLDDFRNIWHTSQSQTYNILTRLEGKGYITSTIIEQERLPSRQELRITRDGRKRFEDWLYKPTGCSVHAIRVEFITRLYFTRLYHPEQVIGIIQEQEQVVEQGIAQLELKKTQSPAGQYLDWLALELRIKLLRSVLDWLKEIVRSYPQVIRRKNVA